ncbi:hypothetical protein AB0F24_38580 [Streptomyces platensis]
MRCVPRVIVTDEFRSCRAAHRAVVPSWSTAVRST